MKNEQDIVVLYVCELAQQSTLVSDGLRCTVSEIWNDAIIVFRENSYFRLAID